MENSLGCPFTTQVDFGNQSVVNTCEAEQTIRLVLPRSMLYKRKRSCPPSIPKVCALQLHRMCGPEPNFAPPWNQAMMLVDVNNLELQLDCSPGGALSVSVAMVPAHELDQHMPVQTRWVRCTSDGSTFKAAWQERLVLCVPDEQVQAIAKGVAEGEPRETDAPMDSITIQARQHPPPRNVLFSLQHLGSQREVVGNLCEPQFRYPGGCQGRGCCSGPRRTCCLWHAQRMGHPRFRVVRRLDE